MTHTHTHTNAYFIFLTCHYYYRGSSGVGNYKGVMLCNRPFAGTGSASKATTHESTTFSCGLVPEKIGINVTISSKQSHKFKRPKKETVLTKHKKWLADLQKTKEALEQQYLDDLKAKEEAQKRFQEQEQRMRAMAKEIAKRAAADDAAAAAAEGKPETNGASPEAQSKDSKAGAVPPLNFKSDSTSGGGGVKFALPKKEGGMQVSPSPNQITRNQCGQCQRMQPSKRWKIKN